MASHNLWFKILFIKKINLGICFFSCSLRRSHRLFILGPMNQLLTGFLWLQEENIQWRGWRSSLLFTIFMTSSWELIWCENILRKLSQAKGFSWIDEEGKKLGKKNLSVEWGDSCCCARDGHTQGPLVQKHMLELLTPCSTNIWIGREGFQSFTGRYRYIIHNTIAITLNHYVH